MLIYDAANWLTNWAGASLTYDANGNLTSDGGLTYSWDSRNRLSAAAARRPASPTMGWGGVAARRWGGTATSFAYDGLNVVQELAGGTPSANLLTGLGVDEPPYPRGHHNATQLPNGSALIFGGYAQDVVRSAELLSPATQPFTRH